MGHERVDRRRTSLDQQLGDLRAHLEATEEAAALETRKEKLVALAQEAKDLLRRNHAAWQDLAQAFEEAMETLSETQGAWWEVRWHFQAGAKGLDLAELADRGAPIEAVADHVPPPELGRYHGAITLAVDHAGKQLYRERRKEALAEVA